MACRGPPVKKDTIIGIVGTLILLVAMVGVFRYEASQGAGSSFAVDWPVSETAAAALTGRTTEGESQQDGVAIDRANLTKVSFVLEWTDDVQGSAPDRFNLTVVAPDGTTRSAEGDAGEVVVTFEGLGNPPPGVQVLGANEAEVSARMARQYSTNGGAGTWNVTIKLLTAGDQNAPVGNLAIQADNGNDWTLTPRLSAYQAKVGRP